MGHSQNAVLSWEVMVPNVSNPKGWTLGHELWGHSFTREHLGLSYVQESPQTSWFPLATWHPAQLHRGSSSPVRCSHRRQMEFSKWPKAYSTSRGSYPCGKGVLSATWLLRPSVLEATLSSPPFPVSAPSMPGVRCIRKVERTEALSDTYWPHLFHSEIGTEHSCWSAAFLVSQKHLS